MLQIATWLYGGQLLGRARVSRVELAVAVRLATRHPWPACWWLAGVLGGRALSAGGARS